MKRKLCFIFAALLAFSLLLAAQTAAPDPALMVKAQAGEAAAQVALGDALAAGSGGQRSTRQIEADYRRAAEWYGKAAAQNDPAGLMRMAALYRDGKGVERNRETAAALYRKAAELGDPEAQATLGLLYSMGQGVPQNYAEAYFWLDLAAKTPGPNQQKYAANRQAVGTRITVSELDAIEERVEKRLAEHPRAGVSK